MEKYLALLSDKEILEGGPSCDLSIRIKVRCVKGKGVILDVLLRGVDDWIGLEIPLFEGAIANIFDNRPVQDFNFYTGVIPRSKCTDDIVNRLVNTTEKR